MPLYLVTHTVTIQIEAETEEEAKDQSFHWLYAECPETWDVAVELMKEDDGTT